MSQDANLDMMDHGAEERPKQKRDLRRILVDAWRRAWMVAVVLAITVGVAFEGGKKLSKETYEADTTLMFRLNDEKKADVDPQKDLLTLKEIVKVRTNLEQVRSRLKLEVPITQLASGIDVEVQKNTNLMVISTTAGTADGAADLANAVREVFLTNQISIDRVVAEGEMSAQSRRLSTITAEMSKADLQLQSFTNKNHVTDFVTMARADLEGFNSVDLLYQTALVEQKTNEQQVANLDRIVREQKAKVVRERAEAQSLTEMTNLSTKIERLRTAIHDDQEMRGRQADLAARQIELETAKRLFEAGAFAKRKVDAAQLAYDKQKAMTVDTEQVRIWRAELQKLEDIVLPSNSITPAGQLLQEMLSKDFNLQLDSVAIESKVASFKAARDDYEHKLSALPDLQRTFVILSRNLDALNEEKKALDEKIAKNRRLLEIRTPDFITVARAMKPTMPKSSNRKTMTMMVGMVVAIIGLGAVLGTILIDPRLKSKGDLGGASKYLVLAEIGTLARRDAVFPPASDSELAVKMSALSRSIRRACPASGAKVAVAGIHIEDGASSIAVSLATALNRQGESVLLAAFSGAPNAVSMARSDERPLDWVTKVNDGDALQNFVIPGDRANPNTLPSLPENVNADAMTSRQMRTELKALSGTYDVVILDLLAATESLQVELLGSFCDGVVLVTRSLHLRKDQVKRIERDLDAAGIRVIGWVINCVPKLYQEPV